MKAHQAVHSVPALCRVLEVSASGYYAWARRRPSRRATDDARLLEQIRQFHVASRGTYGAPRIHRVVRAAGVRVGRKRVARLLKAAGLRGVSRRKWVTTTVRTARAAGARFGAAPVRRAWPESAVGRGYHLHSDRVRPAVSGGGA